ncbi:MAG: hypothetical protein ACPIA4_04605, partial [Flavobacteriales bacterium]
MNALFELIKAMNTYECRHFKLIANRTNQTPERKDIILFDYYRKHNNKCDEKKIAKKLYGDNINAFYRLKNRLLSNLKNSLTLNHMSQDDELIIYRQLFIAKLMNSRGCTDLSIDFLIESEKKAIEKKYPDLLKLIYNEMIKLSYRNRDVDVESLLKKRKNNRAETNRIQEVDDVLAALNYRLKKSQNYNSKNDETLLILEQTIKEFVQDEELMQNVKMKIKVYQSISSILLQKHDFLNLEKYLKKTFIDFRESNVFDKKNHNIKLQMLTYQVNCLCKNNKYKASLEKAKQLKLEMEKFDNLHYDKYLFYYYNGLAINYNKLDKEKAIETLLKAKKEQVIVDSDYNYFFVCSNLALQYFDTKKFKLAIKTLSRIILHQSFLKFEDSLQIKIISAEFIIRYEIGDFYYLEKRIQQTRKQYKEILL